jgi:hypothetical protein
MLFAADMMVCHHIISAEVLCTAKYMKFCVHKTQVIAFSKKTSNLSCCYQVFQPTITRTDTIKDMGMFLASKLCLHNHISFIFSHCIKLLGLVRSVTSNFSSLECIFILYFTLVRSKVEYAFVSWNSLTSRDAKKLERIQQKLAALCFNRFFHQANCGYALALKQ